MKARHVVVAVALVSTGGVAAATLKTVALQGDMSPAASYFYRKFDAPAVGDAPGPHVAVYNRMIGKRCLFKLDPDPGPDATIACERDPSPDGGRGFARFGPVTMNAAGEVAW